MSMEKKPVVKREYMTNLQNKQSVVAFCCGILTLIFAFLGIIAGVINTVAVMNEDGFFSFIYYTMIINTLSAMAISFVIPFAVEGIRNNRFVVPGWVATAHYIAASSITLIMVFVAAFISWADPDRAYKGFNLFTHLICPILILISFFMTENGHIYTLKDRLLGSIPFCLYMVVYFIEVVLIGESRGGWPDIYRITKYAHPLPAIIILLALSFALNTLIAVISNYITRKRTKELFMYWDDDVDPLEVRIEAYGLGRMIAQYGEKYNIQIPVDLLEHLAERYQLDTEILMKAFVKGLLNGFKERD